MPRYTPRAHIDSLESRLLLAANAGILLTGARLPPIATGSLYAAKADFNNDGKLDLAVVGGGFNSNRPFFTGGLQVLLNQGADLFTPAGQLQSLVGPPSSDYSGRPVVAADFNADGNADVAVIDNGKLAIYLGNGAGALASAGQYLANDLNFALTTGDFNGDGRIDLAATGSRILSVNRDIINTEKQIAILINAGSAAFTTVFTHMSGNEGYTAAAIDYDHDGKTDLAVPLVNQVQILTSKGDGTFDFPASIDSGGAWDLVAADLNRDGRPDLLYSTFAANTFGSYALSLPTGGFGPVVHLPPGAGETQGVAAGDFNGDGRTDIEVGNGDTATNAVFLQQPSGVFTPSPDYADLKPSIVGDFNNDGTDDGLVYGNHIIYTQAPPAPPVGPVFTSRKHILVITGNRRADVVTVTLVGANLVTTLNGVTYNTPLNTVRRIEIATGLGTDKITIDPSVFASALISAGAANDTVQAGSGNDTLQGDNGDDILNGGAGTDVIQGGKGNDTLTGAQGADAIYGNRGTDTYAHSDPLSELLDRSPDEPLI
ncbi:MAG: conserved repeat domain [Phycisphaerales bacterium]|nr:conserved repeat domain [Phycisphaerales bacterium]